MPRWPSCVLGSVLGLIAVLGHAAPADAQIKWNPIYEDGVIRDGGTGFADPTILSGETKSLGALRRDSVTAAFDYLNTVIDGRGTINVYFYPSFEQSGNPTLATFRPEGHLTVSGVDGSFQNGQMYERARTNRAVFDSSPDGTGQFNFGKSYNYAGQQNAASSTAYDMVTVTSRALVRGLGFYNGVDQNGKSLDQPVGEPGIYTEYDRHLQRGNGASATPLFHTNINNSNYATFANFGLTDTFTNGNNPNTGLFFGGSYAQEVYGSPVPLYAPATYKHGESIGHDTGVPTGLMNFDLPTNTVRQLQPYEIGMLLDLGWNVYNWDNSTGNWLDGVNPDDPNDLNVANSRWRTNQGIITDGSGTRYNVFGHTGQAPVLPPHGQVTSNIVLNFGGSGSTGYTATNDIGTVRLSRLNLNSTSTGTNTITGGTLLFGKNSDGTDGVLLAKVVQQNSGAFVINSAIQVPNGLVVDGPGGGRVTLSGPISGANALVKDGGFTLAVTGNNTYAGGTFVFDGTLLVNGQTGSNTGTGTDGVVLYGGTLGGNGRVGGSLMSAIGGVAPGADDGATGVLTVGGGVTLSSLTVFEAQLNGTTAGSGYDQLRVESGNVNLAGAGLLLSLGYTPSVNDLLVILNNVGSGTTTGQFSGFSPGSPVNIGGTNVYAFYDYDVATGTFGSGNDVVIAFTANPVSEPAAVLGLGAAGLGLAGLVRRWRRERLASPRVAEATKLSV